MALAIVVLLGAVLTLTSVLLIGMVTDEGGRSARGMQRSAAFQAAEAGLEDYISKNTEDRSFYTNWVHEGESTRRSTGGNLVAAGNAWTYGSSWTYPNGKDAWRSLPNGYEYNVQVSPVTPGSQILRIIATGRRAGSTTELRSVEATIRPASLADFQMVANADISYGSAATTHGKIYAGIDAGGDPKSVNHDGTAYANIYAEGSITGPPTLMNGAQTYDSSTIRTVMKNPVSFSSFVTAIVDVQSAASAGGVYLNDASAHGWRLTFQSGGTFLAQRCTRSGGQHLAAATPVCGSSTTYAVPANGAVYVAQSAIVSGQVNGRVTVASNQDVVIANNISYVASGDDVLGLIAMNEMIVAKWAPTDLSWRAACIAQTGMWRSWDNSGSHNSMTFTGGSATNQGGYMGMFDSRVYNYDTTLLTLAPPWFPVIEEAYTILLFRELPATP
jgi:hypothetical protein